MPRNYSIEPNPDEQERSSRNYELRSEPPVSEDHIFEGVYEDVGRVPNVEDIEISDEDEELSTWSSPLLKAVKDLPTDQDMPPQQFLNMLKKKRGVREEELYFTGFLKYLEDLDNMNLRVNKQEAIDFLEDKDESDRVYQLEEILKEDISDQGKKRRKLTRWGEYTLKPYPEEYKELLIQRVTGTEDSFSTSHWPEEDILVHARFGARTGPYGERVLMIEEIQSDWHQRGRKEGYDVKTGSELPSGWTITRERRYYEPGLDPTEESTETYAKSMFEDDNTIQIKASDDQYYGEIYGPRKKKKDLFFPLKILRLNDLDHVIQYVVRDEEGQPLAEESNRTKAIERAKHVFWRPVPDAPFKKTQDWVKLAMKRVIKHAVENDFEAVGWTIGGQQAERWDDGIMADEIRIDPMQNRVDFLVGGRSQEYEIYDDEEELRVLIGEQAYKMIEEDTDCLFSENYYNMVETIEDAIHDADSEAYWGDISRSEANRIIREERQKKRDLKAKFAKRNLQGKFVVGGEGHRELYDKIIPRVVDKLLKPHGVESTITYFHYPEYRRRHGNLDIEGYKTSHEYLGESEQPMHYFPITESMKEEYGDPISYY